MAFILSNLIDFISIFFLKKPNFYLFRISKDICHNYPDHSNTKQDRYCIEVKECD